MSTILALDASTEACSCAVLHNGLIQERFELVPRLHTQRLLPMIHELMAETGLRFADLDAVAFGIGPGSFTGLRIAAGVAQGIAYAAGLPVLPVSTLAALAVGAAEHVGQALVFSCLDARIDEIYCGWYQVQNGSATLVGTEALLRPESVPAALPPSSGTLVAAGNGLSYAERFPTQFMAGFANTLPAMLPHSYHMACIASSMWERGESMGPELITPVYLRDKVTQSR